MHSEIASIRQKMLNVPWPKFLRAITLDGLRGWEDAEVRFTFPVSVVCGENGSGKSTVLMAAASAYQDPAGRKTYSPSEFFKTSPWDSNANCTIGYRIIEGSTERTYTFKKRNRWIFSGRPRREVVYETIARTLPIENLAGYARITTSRAQEASRRELAPELKTYYKAILGRQYESIGKATADVDVTKQVGIVSLDGNEYSAFHQGAGEASLLEMMDRFAQIPNTSLVIIDEVEASLHPRAQRRLIHYLLWLARTKQLQIILSSHSGYVIDELPEDSRIFLNRSSQGVDVLYGMTSAFALTRMDDLQRPDLYIYVEDLEASIALHVILVAGGIQVERLQILQAGPANSVAMLHRLSEEKRLPVPVLAMVDGDADQLGGCVSLPGTVAPERVAFQAIVDSGINEAATRLGASPEDLERFLRNAMTLSDHHAWLTSLASALQSERTSVWRTLCQVWVQNILDPAEIVKIAAVVKDRLAQLG